MPRQRAAAASRLERSSFASRVLRSCSGLPLGRRCRSKGCDALLFNRYAGANTALAKRDAPDLAGRRSLAIRSGWQKAADTEAEPGLKLVTELLVLVAPGWLSNEDVEDLASS